MTALAALLLAATVGTVEGTIRAPDIRTGDAVVYLVSISGSSGIDRERATIDQRNLRFVPRVLAISPASEVDFLNSDPLLHNVFSPRGAGPGFDLGSYRLGERRSHAFVEEGAHVILCHIHPEMVAYVVVVPSRLRAITDRDGGFRIEGVPPGRYELHMWHARLQPTVREVTVTAGETARVDLSAERRHRGGL